MMARQKIDVLYIHPARSQNDYNIPMGLLGLMNSIDCIKAGKMFFEVTEDIISKAKIIVMDCHWYCSLSEVGILAKKFKKINPDIVIIVGGYTATIFAETVVDNFKIDYVIKGDAEVPFPMLIKALLSGRNVKNIPNIVSRTLIAPQSYKLSKEDYSNSDCINIDWFPELRMRMKVIHKEFPFSWNEYLGIYPFIPVFKGCLYDCKFCYAGKALNFALCKRGIVSRTPESIINDLTACSRHKDIKQVYMIADFINILGISFAEKIFSDKYDLNLHYSFDISNTPVVSILEKMLSSFNRCRLSFIFSEYFHKNSAVKRYKYLAETFDYLKRYKDRISLKLFVTKSKGSRIFEKLSRKLTEVYKGLELLDNSQWFSDIPYPTSNYKQNAEEYFNIWVKKSNKAQLDTLAIESRKDNIHKFYLELLNNRQFRKIFKGP